MRRGVAWHVQVHGCCRDGQLPVIRGQRQQRVDHWHAGAVLHLQRPAARGSARAAVLPRGALPDWLGLYRLCVVLVRHGEERVAFVGLLLLLLLLPASLLACCSCRCRCLLVVGVVTGVVACLFVCLVVVVIAECVTLVMLCGRGIKS